MKGESLLLSRIKGFPTPPNDLDLTTASAHSCKNMGYPRGLIPKSTARSTTSGSIFSGQSPNLLRSTSRS
jgi:hypothetical protein